MLSGDTRSFIFNYGDTGPSHDFDIYDMTGDNEYEMEYYVAGYDDANALLAYRVTLTDAYGFTQSYDFEHRMANAVYVETTVAGTISAAAAHVEPHAGNREDRTLVLFASPTVRLAAAAAEGMIFAGWYADDLHEELVRLIKGSWELPHRDEILELIASEKNPDRREQLIRHRYPTAYARIKAQLYPLLRAVSFRYDLRRKGMIKDTIHTTELDTTYARGVELLQKRKYAKALYILNDYNDRNTVVAHLSLGHDEQALELLAVLPKDAATEYLKAIACSRLGCKDEGRKHFLEACRLDERMEYRGNLDPEITELLKD